MRQAWEKEPTGNESELETTWRKETLALQTRKFASSLRKAVVLLESLGWKTRRADRHGGVHFGEQLK
jgi:hypothetical protein